MIDSLETHAVNDYNQRHPDEETKEENNDGWETVGKKPQIKHKQTIGKTSNVLQMSKSIQPPQFPITPHSKRI
ncbi:hypothetical protein LXL04_014919 [Taraxacum kok-saghyz]